MDSAPVVTKKKRGLKGKGTVVAVGLLAALGAWAWFGERGEVYHYRLPRLRLPVKSACDRYFATICTF